MIHIVFELIRVVLSLLTVVLIVHVVLSWLIAFEIVSRRNAFIGGLFTFTTRLTDPMVRPLRRLIPPIGGVDLSILVLLLVIWFARELTWWLEDVLRGGPVL
jgi:YggT family protein